MPKTIAPLTDAQCRKLKAPENGIAQLSDGGGLTLQVSHKGKYWRLRYYFNGKREEVRLGVYPAISLREARIKREEIRQMVLQGTDSKSRKIAALDAVFETVARKWHADQTAKPDKWVPAHAKRVLRSLELHIFPAIGKKPLDCIAPLEILTLLQRLEADGKNDTAHKVYNVVNQVFKYAVRLRLCTFNPAAELRQELAEVKHTHYRTVLDPAEIGRLLRALDGYTGTPQTCVLLRLSPYLFARPIELRSLRWCEINLETKQYTKAAGEMKGRIGHIVPLCRQAIELLESLRPVTGHYEHVFTNKTTGKYLSEGAARKALKRLGWHDYLTPHGFRSMASTHLNEMNMPADWVERQLSHKEPNKSRAAYNHAQHLADRAEMMQQWADFLDDLKNTP